MYAGMDANTVQQPNHFDPIWPLRDPTTPRLSAPKGGGEGGGGGGEGSRGGLPAPSPPVVADRVLHKEREKKMAASAPPQVEENEICTHDAANKPNPPKVCHTTKNRVKFYCGGENYSRHGQSCVELLE